MNNKIYKPKEFSKLVNVTVNTLQRWDREGVLPAKRTATNKRYYTDEDIHKILGTEPVSNTNRVSVGYARVSTAGQKKHLENQKNYISEYINKKYLAVETIYTDVGSGLNYKRRNWNKLIKRVMNDEIDKIYITYKDRFVRFGYEWFEELCQEHNTEIVILNKKQTSPEEELVEDLMSIVHVFSARSCGLRSCRQKLEETLKEKGG